MKNLAYIFAVGAAVFSLSSCKQNTEPKYQKATEEFTLNTPAFASEYFELTPEGTINLTWSQPDWGFAAAATYVVQISFEQEFHYYENDTPSNMYSLPTTFATCNADVPMKDIAEGMSQLRGITDLRDWTEDEARTLYVRIEGYIPQVENSHIWSNVIKLDNVLGYAAVRQPGKIYLVGAPEGWLGPEEANADHYDEWALVEQNVDEEIYYGSFTIGAGSDAMFRFYTALTGWDDDTWGAPDGNDDDNPVTYDYAGDGTFESTLISTKDSFSFPNWAGGIMDMKVSFAEDPATLTITVGE